MDKDLNNLKTDISRDSTPTNIGWLYRFPM